ncbi:MAG: homoserine O-acetyltransferase MetX [Puniceicoccales bacterium]
MIVELQRETFTEPLSLDCGEVLPRWKLAYETYGTLNDDASNAILIFHGLVGDAHAAGLHTPKDPLVGWWDGMIGSGKAFDTDRFFVICINLLGGCGGSTGPASLNPETGKPYGLDFPLVTLADMVRSQDLLLRKWGIEKLFCVVGPSTGSMLALQWVKSFPGRVQGAILIAGPARLSAQSLALNWAMREAVKSDPHYRNGDYYGQEPKPMQGAALAFALGAIGWMTPESMQEKFGRKMIEGRNPEDPFGPQFLVEGFLRKRGVNFCKFFDPNSLLYMTRAIDHFDAGEGADSLAEAFRDFRAKFLVVTYDTDWRYPPHESREIVDGLEKAGVSVHLRELSNPAGHAAFLRHTDQLTEEVAPFLEELVATGDGVG